MTPHLAGAVGLRYIMAYDSDCGICTRFKNMINFLDTQGRLTFTPLISADNDGLLDSIPRNRRHRSFHLVNPSGRVYSGADALPVLFGLLPAGWALESVLRSSPPAMWLTRILYGNFVRYHDSGSCSYAVELTSKIGTTALESVGPPPILHG